MEYTNQALYNILNLAIKKAVKKNILLRYTINQKDNYVLCLPISHIAGLSILYRAIYIIVYRLYYYYTV